MIFLLGLLISMILGRGDRCLGYIMPAEQLIDFMTRNFSALKTLVVTQSTLRIDKDQERVFMEQVLTKSPDLFNLKILDQRVERQTQPDLSYRQLLMANPADRIERLLTIMGIRLDIVALTRIDGVIAYRIGEKDPDKPKLLIEKERFLPLLLVYLPSGDTPEDIVTVRFRDYRKQDKEWYPFDITYSTGSGIREQYTILSFQPNAQAGSSMLRPFETQPGPDQPPEGGPSKTEEERLRNIIKAFEEKYQ